MFILYAAEFEYVNNETPCSNGYLFPNQIVYSLSWEIRRNTSLNQETNKSLWGMGHFPAPMGSHFKDM